jgi:hypothetical protein
MRLSARRTGTTAAKTAAQKQSRTKVASSSLKPPAKAPVKAGVNEVGAKDAIAKAESAQKLLEQKGLPGATAYDKAGLDKALEGRGLKPGGFDGLGQNTHGVDQFKPGLNHVGEDGNPIFGGGGQGDKPSNPMHNDPMKANDRDGFWTPGQNTLEGGPGADPRLASGDTSTAEQPTPEGPKEKEKEKSADSSQSSGSSSSSNNSSATTSASSQSTDKEDSDGNKEQEAHEQVADSNDGYGQSSMGNTGGGNWVYASSLKNGQLCEEYHSDNGDHHSSCTPAPGETNPGHDTDPSSGAPTEDGKAWAESMGKYAHAAPEKGRPTATDPVDPDSRPAERVDLDWETAKQQGQSQEINYGQEGGGGTSNEIVTDPTEFGEPEVGVIDPPEPDIGG